MLRTTHPTGEPAVGMASGTARTVTLLVHGDFDRGTAVEEEKKKICYRAAVTI
jgi:hypothetical protein